MTVKCSKTKASAMPARVCFVEQPRAVRVVLVVPIFSVVLIQLIAETIPVSVRRFFGCKFLCQIVIFVCEIPAHAIPPILYSVNIKKC